MRNRRCVFLPVLAAPLLLGQLSIEGCLPTLSGGGTNNPGVTSPIFNLPPNVVLTADVVRGVAPLTVKFSSSGSTDEGVIVSRLWNFGDNQTSQEISPTHTFQTTGQFTVRLTLTDDRQASASRTLTISVTQQPVAAISVDRTTAESAPAVFNFSASNSFDPDGTIERYQWDFGDGSRELLPVITHTFATAGKFQVRLTVTDNTGVTAVANQIVEIGIPSPTIEFRSPPPSLQNIVVSSAAPIWINVVFGLTPNVPYNLRAGIDGDRDICEAQAALFATSDGASLESLTGHASPVRGVAYSPDGSVIASCSDDGTVRLYNAINGDFLRSASGLGGVVTGVAFAPDSSRYVLGTTDRNVLVRAVADGGLVQQFVGHGAAVSSVAYAPNGARVLSGDGSGVALLWDITSGAQVQSFVGHSAAINSVAFAPNNSNLVATGSDDQTAKVWNAATGSVVRTFAPVFQNGALVAGHSNSVTSVAISPDGTLLLTGSVDRTAILWELATGGALRTLAGHTDRVTAVAFSPDGTQVLTGSGDGSARLWTTATGAQVRALRPCSSTISSVAFSPDGVRALLGVAASNDIQLDTVPPSGNDLNLTVPTALSLSGVGAAQAGRQYALWAEVDTDRTDPQRTYANAALNIVPPYTTGIDDFTPRVPLVNDEAAVVVAPTRGRQVFDLGPLRAGDRLIIEPMEVPGYGRAFSATDFTALILDADQKVFALFTSDSTLLADEANYIIGHTSSKYYCVIDTPVSVFIRVVRGGALEPRPQRVLLNFVAAENVIVGGGDPLSIPAFDASELNGAWGAPETTQIKNSIRATLESLFSTWNVDIATTDDSELPDLPYTIVYFAIDGEPSVDPNNRWGAFDFFDPRNQTQSGNALVDALLMADDFSSLSPTDFGAAVARVAARQLGALMGLRLTEGTTDIMSPTTSPDNPALGFTIAPLLSSELPNGTIGQQDAPLIFNEVLGNP